MPFLSGFYWLCRVALIHRGALALGAWYLRRRQDSRRSSAAPARSSGAAAGDRDCHGRCRAANSKSNRFRLPVLARPWRMAHIVKILAVANNAIKASVA
jgi:hypothetical protein